MIVSRPKEFNPDQALDSALECFKRHGFNGASMSTLTKEMGVGRASIYATYGDKRALFMNALTEYSDATIGFFVARLDAAEDPLEGIRSLVRDIASRSACDDGRFGCFLVNSASELAANDPEIRAFVARSFERIEAGYVRALERAREQGQIGADKDLRSLARFLCATVIGLRVLGKARPEPGLLGDVAENALRCLE
jgi:TetR/AcrR family transcriptional repressor of nem operon